MKYADDTLLLLLLKVLLRFQALALLHLLLCLLPFVFVVLTRLVRLMDGRRAVTTSTYRWQHQLAPLISLFKHTFLRLLRFFEFVIAG